MKSGGGVLCISALQLVVGLILLGIYEGYKVHWYLTYLVKLLVDLFCQVYCNNMHLIRLGCNIADQVFQ